VRGIEFFRNVSIGQYRPGTSYVHRLRPSTKYLWLLALMAAGIASSSYAGVLLPLLLALAIGASAKISPGFLLRGVKPLLPLLLFTALLQTLFSWPGDTSRVLVHLGPIGLTAREGGLVLMMGCRTLALMTVLGLFTSVTSEGESVHGIEDCLAPLSRLGLHTQRLALAAGIALRFVPIIAGELESIAKAQASRGADFGSGRGGPLAKARAYLPLFVPVTVRALERAEVLAEAMEARGYVDEGRTRLASYPKQRGESLARAAAVLACAASLIMDQVSRRISGG
jgi:energy-coupling factor transport system permease protein